MSPLRTRLLGSILLCVLASACSAPGVRDLVNDIAARDGAGRVHAVIEIPAGTNAKWEVDKADGRLRHEIKNGVPRIVQYLPYPANYGMIPQTVLPKALGGDGDPLDVIVLGPALARGSVVPVRVIGVLELLDHGERDDKLIAVAPDGPFGALRDLTELDARFVGVRPILQTWFTHYKGPGVMQAQGWGDAARAQEILSGAERAYSELRNPEATQSSR